MTPEIHGEDPAGHPAGDGCLQHRNTQILAPGK